jgi:hypothetical protein
MKHMGTHRNVSILLKITFENSITFIDKGSKEKINALLATVAPEISETFQMAIQDFLDESIQGALNDLSKAILATEDAAEEVDMADCGFKKQQKTEAER